MDELSPPDTGIGTPDKAAYEKWLREKVAASLADERPNIPHDEVMAEMRAVIEGKGKPAKAC